MKWISIGALCACFSFLGAEELAVTDESLPRLPEQTNVQSSILIPHCKGLVLVEKRSDMLSQSALENVEGLEVIGLDVPGGEGRLNRKLKPLYLNRSLTAPDVEDIQDSIREYFQTYHRPFVIVEIPEQEVTSGVLQIVVFESKLGKVAVHGNKWSDDKRLESYLHLDPGQMINQQRLLEDLDFINRNPFRRADIIYAPGEEEGTTDVILDVDERRSYRFYAGAENTGVPSTDRQRWFAGFNWGNAFGLDHIFAYQYTASYDVDKFQAHTVQYIAPLSWHHILDVFGGVSWVHPDLEDPSSDSRGFSGQASGRYIIPFFLGMYLRQELIFGFDYKRTNNTVEFTDDLPGFGKNVNLTQFVFVYAGIFERNSYRLDFEGGLYWSPGRWLSDQSNDDFDSLRNDAKNHWVYFLGSISYLQRLQKSFSLYLLAEGQLSSQNLLPSEQFGLGGYDTVRGYNQREVSTEYGLLLSGELRLPAMPLFSNLKRMKRADAIQFLLFLDYGYGRYKKKIPNEPKNQYLMGIGPGIRYTLEPYLTARIDWGIKLHQDPRYGGGKSMVHFAVTGSF